MLDGLADRLDDGLRAGDDRALWEAVAARVAEDVAGLDLRLPSPPRHATLALARVRRHRPGVHPDEKATFQATWERERGGTSWTWLGAHPQLRRRRGSFHATVCLPAGTVGLAWVEALVLWRPHVPWAPADDVDRGDARGHHETGRQTYRYRREADGSWRFLGVHDA